ncbi:TVP38/TMEM64 family protein [Candidatus Campbellbacteria bacterium]|nr:MAG: TVP38/TMEM64 family protein [Candidatus Campbellbacteria bacterium]
MISFRSKMLFLFLWILVVCGGLFVYVYYPTLFQRALTHVMGVSVYFGYALLLLIGALRGFTLVPSTYLIVVGLFFFAPVPLFFVILAGIIISSISVYYFSEYLHVDTFFEKKHHARVVQIRTLLEKNELPIIILWSFAPILPTDIICYVCGTLRVDIRKFVLGITIGEGTIVALYIFFGQYLLKYSHTLLSLFV